MIFMVALGTSQDDARVRILVVEDEKRLAELLRDGLSREGFAVDVAHDGRDGLWLATENAYDVIVLDVLLPELNGYNVCTRLREAGVWTPILVLTAKDGTYDEAEALDIGADDFLSKPFSYVVLLARLRALLRRAPQDRPTVLVAGDVRLDPATRRVTVADRPVSLTPRELGVLEYLLRRPDRLVTKLEILDHVWDSAAEVNPNAVEVYVGYLRRKLGRPLVETVRGAGYRLQR
jgi:DNA-binding response OmpR family regulator